MAYVDARQDKLGEQLEGGRRSEALISAGLLDLLAERESGAINEMIRWFRGEGALDPSVGLRYIAVLNEVYAQREEIEYRAKKAAQARAELYGGKKDKDSTDETAE